MKDKTYRRLFQETKRQAFQRHNRIMPTLESYHARRSRMAEGYEVVNSVGQVVAQSFDDEAEALKWIADNPPKR
jgi:hypothetical protein